MKRNVQNMFEVQDTKSQSCCFFAMMWQLKQKEFQGGGEKIARKDHKVPFYFKKVAKETILFKHPICAY